MATLTVGPGKQHQTVAAAVAAAQPDDIIEVDAGDYIADWLVIDRPVTIKGIGGLARLDAAGNGPPNDKGIITCNASLTLDHIELCNVVGASRNAAGIRYQKGEQVTLSNCYIHHCENGILANEQATGNFTITDSEFAYCGYGDGQTHNIYIGKVATLRMDNCWSHDCSVGHELKSRAKYNEIRNSRFTSKYNASYQIDFPNQGDCLVKNCYLHQTHEAGNYVLLSYGAEANPWPDAESRLLVEDTVLNNQYYWGGQKGIANHGKVAPELRNLTVYGLESWNYYYTNTTPPTPPAVAENIQLLPMEAAPPYDETSPVDGGTEVPPPIEPEPEPEPPQGDYATRAEFDALAAEVGALTTRVAQVEMSVANLEVRVAALEGPDLCGHGKPARFGRQPPRGPRSR